MKIRKQAIVEGLIVHAIVTLIVFMIASNTIKGLY
jgi:hypothetical protein